MSLQTVEMNSVKIIFDQKKTKAHRTTMNSPCDCQDCRDYYKHVENNVELVEFLSGFGIDYNCTEEVLSWDLGNGMGSLIHHEGYYGVFGIIEGEEFDFEKFGVKITFQKCAAVPCDRNGEYFWICVEGDFSYILDEKRDLPILFSEKNKNLSIVKKIKAVLKKK